MSGPLDEALGSLGDPQHNMRDALRSVSGQAQTNPTAAVLAVIDANDTHPDNPASRGCSNGDIVEATGLTPDEVASILDGLWRADQVEGILTIGGVWPHAVGIVRVRPDRDRVWGGNGRYKPRAR
jgi:hypothetical protein